MKTSQTQETQMNPSTPSVPRSFTMELDIAATPDEVWRALTDAGELVRWFPLQARVTPGTGGSMFWGWNGRWSWESTIAAWEPAQRLRLVENRPAFDVEGNPVQAPARELAMEFTLETHKGGTRLRLVHSGFGEGASWDDEVDAVSAGWQYELRALRHYLERHAGRDRTSAVVHHVTPLPIEGVWRWLLGPSLFDVGGRALSPGSHCIVRIATGDEIAGTIAWHNPGRDLFVIADDLDGVFRLAAWRAGDRTGVQAWFVSYDDSHAARIQQLAARVAPLLPIILQPAEAMAADWRA